MKAIVSYIEIATDSINEENNVVYGDAYCNVRYVHDRGNDGQSLSVTDSTYTAWHPPHAFLHGYQ